MISETTSCREAALSGRVSFLNTGTGIAAIRVYGGTRPATAADAPGTAMLVEIPLENTTGSVSAGALSLNPADTGLIANTGMATWVRVVNRNGDTGFDMDAGLEASGAECEMSEVDLFAGGLVSVVSAVLQ
jgi:hypothetical protein